VDWSLFVRARTGHVTYAPDEPGLRDRLMAPAAGGTAWRCLRCGAFVTGGQHGRVQHGSGPAAAAPLLRRGRELRSELILRAFAVDRFLRFLILGAAAYRVWRFTYDRAGLQRAFNHALPAIRALYRDLGFNVNNSKLLPFIQHSFTHTSRWLTLVTCCWSSTWPGPGGCSASAAAGKPTTPGCAPSPSSRRSRPRSPRRRPAGPVTASPQARRSSRPAMRPAPPRLRPAPGRSDRHTAGDPRHEKLLALVAGTLAALLLSSSLASASTLPDCLARQHVCVTSNGRTLISEGSAGSAGAADRR
jgi:hypothetical protein